VEAMARLLIYFRRHWQALLVLVVFMWQLRRGDSNFNVAMWIAVGFAVAGMAMNLVVILVNRGMPAQVNLDAIPDADRPHYHPISQTTRLALLSDWIPLGNLLISPGDVALLVSVAILLVASLVG